MYLNQFSLRIPKGNEVSGGYVELNHGDKYTIMLRNDRSVRCDVALSIDGEFIGNYRIAPRSTLRLERPQDQHKKFTFYKQGTKKAKKAQLDQVRPDKLGLVEAIFTPEWIVPKVQSWTITTYPAQKWDSGDYNFQYTDNTSAGSQSSAYLSRTASFTGASHEPGGTGLSGHSDQEFTTVSAMPLDFSQQTIITLRLVSRRKKKNNKAYPLVQRGNPVPPPVE